MPDTDSIAFNPESGLLHRISGASSYRNNPARIGYRDDQFMETLNINDPVNSQVGIFNANYEGGPMFDPTDGTNINYGLPAPFPTWVYPDHRRTDDETDPSFEASGPNEFHSMRDFTWSNDQHLFIGTDESGLYKLTADGQSTFFSFPISQPKGITFYTASDGQRKLMVSERDGPNLWTIDPSTGQVMGDPVQMVDENGSPLPGVVSVVEDPLSNTLLGIAKSVTDPGNANARELIRIALNTPLPGKPKKKRAKLKAK